MSRDPFQALNVSPSAVPAASAPAPAVEIVTALGDSVLAVDQLTPAPARSSRSRLFLTLGGGLLLAAATTFAVGVYQASSNAAARARWQDANRPLAAFRPTHTSTAADVLALGGLLGGLGLCAAGLMAARRPARTSFRVGTGEGVDVELADAGMARTLVKADGAGGFVVDLHGLTGELREAGRATALADLAAAGQHELPVRVGTHVRATVGRTTFHVRGQHAATRPLGPAPLFVERHGLGYFAGTAAAAFALLALIHTVEPVQESASAELVIDEDSRMVALNASKDDPPPPPPEDGDQDGGESVPSEAPSMALDDGTLGHTDGSANPARLKVANRGLTPQMSREQAIAAATAAGVLGAVDFAGPVRTIDGFAVASGMDDIDFAGGLQPGDGDGVPVGSFGWGVSGFGTGCGAASGRVCEGVRAGPFATIGDRPGNGTNLRYLPGMGPGPGKRVAAAPKVDIGKPVACSDESPCLDEAMIRRYVRRHIEKIGYCYEKELLAQPQLEGTVVASFTLNGQGAVIESRASGVSPEVSSCIAGVMSNIKFPKVGDTGIYPIRYPFNLRPTGR